MKIYDFSKRELTEMPLINETSKFEYILDNNLITQIEEIPQNCSKLSLSNNKISFINSKFLSDLQIKYLDLSFNRIISLIGFEKFSLLEELNLSNNYIGDDQLNYLSSLSKLKSLNLSNNNLKGEEIKKVIYSIKSLQKINLSNNNIERLIFDKSNGLIELELDNNKLNYLSFNANNNPFNYMMYLSANENNLQTIENISNLINLEYLSLSVNELKKINIQKLTKLKYLQLKSNLLENLTIHKSNKLLQYIDASFNNINSFAIMGECSSLKNLILDNNKLTNIKFEENQNINDNINKFKNLELLEISFNLISNIKFLIIFKNVQKLNISFNNIDNLIDLLSLLKNFSQLKDLNLMENEFNKNIYNVEALNDVIFNNINDYLNSPNVKNMYKSQLMSYRSCIIININNIICLDNINITKEEKKESMKSSEYKLNLIDLKTSNFSIYNNKNKFNNNSQENNMFNSNNSKKELNNISDFNNFIIDSSISKDGDFNNNDLNLNDVNNENDIELDMNMNKNKYFFNSAENDDSDEDIINSNNENDILEQNYKLVSNKKIANLKNDTKSINSKKNKSPFQYKKTKDNSFNDIDIQSYNNNTFTNLKNDNDYIPNSTNKNKLNQNIYNTNANQDDKVKVYKMLCQTLYNLCDNKGYIYFKYFLSLDEELVLEYNISSQLNEMTKEIKKVVQSSLLPGKFHIKDILKIIQNKKYDIMFEKISQSLKKKPSSLISQSIHLSQCVKQRALKQENDKGNNDMENNFTNYQSKIKQNQEYSKSAQKNEDDDNINNKINEYKKNLTYNNGNDNDDNENNEKYYKTNYNKINDYNILNTLKMKTPLLSTYRNSNADKNYNDNLNSNSNDDEPLNKGCFNILFQSCSELDKLPDLKNQLFLQNFLYFINHISFPIHFKEAEQSFIITISSQEKEYKFIQAFMSNFRMKNFDLKKWYCHNYYQQIFEDFECYEFLFEHSVLIFYSYYNEIIDNFFNDVYQIQDCYLIIEDNPLNLFEQNTNDEIRIVMLVLIQWKDYNDDNKQIENIVYNKNDNRYYFKNPFNWIGNYNKKNEFKKSNMSNRNHAFNILVPVYIFSSIIFNNEDGSSFVKLNSNTINKNS